MQVYDFATKEAAHLLLPNSGEEKEPQRKKKKKNRSVTAITCESGASIRLPM